MPNKREVDMPVPRPGELEGVRSQTTNPLKDLGFGGASKPTGTGSSRPPPRDDQRKPAGDKKGA